MIATHHGVDRVILYKIEAPLAPKLVLVPVVYQNWKCVSTCVLEYKKNAVQ